MLRINNEYRTICSTSSLSLKAIDWFCVHLEIRCLIEMAGCWSLTLLFGFAHGSTFSTLCVKWHVECLNNVLPNLYRAKWQWLRWMAKTPKLNDQNNWCFFVAERLNYLGGYCDWVGKSLTLLYIILKSLDKEFDSRWFVSLL